VVFAGRHRRASSTGQAWQGAVTTSRLRPWKLASQEATLDQLSDGRAIVTLAVGAPTPDLPETGEETDLRLRAERLDEGIDLMRQLWAGERSYGGNTTSMKSRSRTSLPLENLFKSACLSGLSPSGLAPNPWGGCFVVPEWFPKVRT